MDCKTVTIFGNKGGVGKTFAAVNLATALAVSNKKVLLLDLDLSASQDMSRMLNITPRNSMVDVLAILNSLETDEQIRTYATVHSSKVEIFPAVENIRQIGKLTADNIKLFIKKASAAYDFIIIDAGNDFTETLMTILDYSHLIFLVATPDILAVAQIKKCLEVLQSLHFPLKMIKLLLNRSESRGSVAWQDVRSALTCEIFSHIPSDGKAVGMALNRGVPCVIDSPKSRASEAFIKIAGMLKKEEIYMPMTETTRIGRSEELKKHVEVLREVGVPPVVSKVAGSTGIKADDELTLLKKKIHEKLVDRLNREGITIDNLSDQETLLEVKKMSEQIVSTLLTEEVGGKIASHEERVALVKDIINEALGLGPLEIFLADSAVTDIMANSKDEIYVERNGKLVLTDKAFLSDDKMRSIIDRIVAPLGRRIDESTPMVDARLPDGSRFNAIIPPLSLRGPMMTIRKFAEERYVAEDLMTKFNSLNQPMVDFLKNCVYCRKNMIVSGGTGSGKTTLLNVISEFIPDGERIITIEDAAELQIKKAHWARLESRPKNIEGRGEVTIRDLFVNCLRMRPDRIVIGECRGAEVLDMLQAMNTGHDGSLTTLHANSTKDAMTRLHSLMLLSGIELPVRAVNEMIASAIHIIVHVNRFSDGTRKITGITETQGLDSDHQLIIKDVFVFNQKGLDGDGKVLGDFQATGFVPQVYQDFLTRGLKYDEKNFQK